jgi:hypothetical protein
MNPMRAPSGQARPTADGRRPTLSDSINRLDQILEGLAEAIPATIRDTLREGLAAAVGEGVRAALIDALAADGLLDRLRGLLVASPAPAPKPSLGRRWQSKARAVLAAARTWIGTKVRSAVTRVARARHQLWNRLTGALRWLKALVRLSSPRVVALSVGSVAVLALAVPAWGMAVRDRAGAAAVRLGQWIRAAVSLSARAGA